jgi:hypothetical protein
MKETPLTILLPQETHAALEKISKQNGTSKRWEARKVVIEAIKTDPVHPKRK